uniref:Uncharacterized protein n=1 Tax=Panagrolaimus davidi TaxID=227884 RepID=A0A914QDA7_9BILA
MIISQETYDKCCPSYKEAVDKLETKIAQIKNSNVNTVTKFEKFCHAISDFSKSYLTPSEYWNYIMNQYSKDQLVHINNVEAWKNSCRNIAKWALFHLCYNKEWNAIRYKIRGGVYHYFSAYDDTHLQLLDFQNDFYFQPGKRERVKFLHFRLRFKKFYLEFGTPEFHKYIVTDDDLLYPHNRLQECMLEYEKESSPSARLMNQYHKMKAFYHKIISVEHDVEEWFDVLLETCNFSFILHNVEYRLGKSLCNIKLWKLYIDFLEEQREYRLWLETSLKYCRFFVDDKKMKEKCMARFGGQDFDKIYSCKGLSKFL